MSAALEILAGLLVLAGSAFALTASVGLLRFPDLFSRMHAASKAGTVGSGLTLLAVAIMADDTGEVMRSLSAVLFVLLTAPLSAHLLAKATHSAGYPLWRGTVLNEMPPPEKRRADEIDQDDARIVD